MAGRNRRPAEATFERTALGVVPQGDGWFVANARDVTWLRSAERGQDTDFEGRADFPQVGFRLHVLSPGQRNGMYHGESGQEDFLVLSGECIVILEGEERRLRAWDFVHCPSWARHVFVGAGDGPCVIAMAGRRSEDWQVVYPVDEVAARHHASVLEETAAPEEAYSRFSAEERTRYEDGWLP